MKSVKQIKLVEEGIILNVNYSRTLKEMIIAGNYDWINGDIKEKNFPLPTELLGKKITASNKLFHFNRSISSENAISEMNKAGYRPATLAELLALGEAYPEQQKEFPIVALGSIWCRTVPGFGFVDFERRLGLAWFGIGWEYNYRFLAVRK